MALGLVAVLLSAALTGSGMYFGMNGAIGELKKEQEKLRTDLTAVQVADLNRRVDAAWTTDDMRRYIQLARTAPLLRSLPTVDDMRYSMGPLRWSPTTSDTKDPDARPHP